MIENIDFQGFLAYSHKVLMIFWMEYAPAVFVFVLMFHLAFVPLFLKLIDEKIKELD